MHRPYWQSAAIVFSAAWIIAVGVFIGLSAYHQFACTPTVEHLPDGTIIRHACVAAPLTWRVIAYVTGYLVGGAVVVSLLCWIFLGWPSEVVSRFLSRTRPKG
jgi:tryptophan-rich sensory protein